MIIWPAVVIFCFGYMCGSIPSGYIAGRIAGVDIRQTGSGNIGATNVVRVLGKKFGYAVFIADVVKGLIAVRLAFLIANRMQVPRDYLEYYAVLGAVMCILGHSFSFWLGFKGGKGVATSAGAIFGLMPLTGLIVFLVWLGVFEMTRYVSVASIAATISLPITVAVMLYFHVTTGVILLYFSVTMAALVIWRHRSNFVRLRNGTEQRFERK